MPWAVVVLGQVVSNNNQPPSPLMAEMYLWETGCMISPSDAQEAHIWANNMQKHVLLKEVSVF